MSTERICGPLVDRELRAGGFVEPLDERLVNTNSIDLTLAGRIGRVVPRSGPFVLGSDASDVFEMLDVPPDELVRLDPGEFILASSAERLCIPAGFVAMVWGKSSVARSGVQVHAAGWVDTGFVGDLTLEMCNLMPHPISIPVGARICQLVVMPTELAERLYGERGRYQGQCGPTGPRPMKENP